MRCAAMVADARKAKARGARRVVTVAAALLVKTPGISKWTCSTQGAPASPICTLAPACSSSQCASGSMTMKRQMDRLHERRVICGIWYQILSIITRDSTAPIE